MPERLDIVIPAQAKLPSFLVNNAVADVLSLYSGGSTVADGKVFNGGTEWKFAKGDNFTIGSIGLTMPLSFQINRSSTCPVPFIIFRIAGVGITTGKTYLFKELGGAGTYIYGVAENYDTPLDLFINIQDQSAVTGTYIKDETFYLSLLITLPRISMTGVPAGLNGQTHLMTPYMKIYHNNPLTS